GSGARSLAGMRTVSGLWRRPFLALDRGCTRTACAAQGLPVWDDPHNADPRFARVRVRHEALPGLERALGPGVPAALARTADRVRDDADALDGWASRVLAGPDPAEVGALAALPRAVRSRVLRGLAAQAGAGPLEAVHVSALEALVSDWHGQGTVALPGGL